MSRNNRSSKLALRIICGLLAALMVLGGLVSIGFMLVDHAHAAEYPEDLRVHIGLKYASTMQASYAIYSESGFSVVNQNVSDRSMRFEEERGPGTKKGKQPLGARKGKETASPVETLEGTNPTTPYLSPVKLMSNF